MECDSDSSAYRSESLSVLHIVVDKRAVVTIST